jgi:hypothetical protein
LRLIVVTAEPATPDAIRATGSGAEHVCVALRAAHLLTITAGAVQ